MAGRGPRFRSRKDVGIGAPKSCASLDHCFPGKRSQRLTLGARGALPPLPQRAPDGVPHAEAASVGSADAGLDQLSGGTDRIRSGYESEAAFNRAFKREFAVPPARFRSQSRSAAATAPGSRSRFPMTFRVRSWSFGTPRPCQVEAQGPHPVAGSKETHRSRLLHFDGRNAQGRKRECQRRAAYRHLCDRHRMNRVLPLRRRCRHLVHRSGSRERDTVDSGHFEARWSD
jgi:hypothetical protein